METLRDINFLERFDGSEWTIDFEFRSNGEERGSGNLQLWYVKDGLAKISTASIYTVGPFDGFALAIDVNGGRVSGRGPRGLYYYLSLPV